jgi:hypothetical protein
VTGPALDRCEKTDMLRSGCAHCTGRTGSPEPRVSDREGWGPWFTAQLHGRCAGPCDEHIHPDDRIRADGEGGYLCEECGAAEEGR